MKLPILALAACALVASAAQAADDARFAATTLDLSGHGEAHAPPDTATIDLGVTADAPTAADALGADAAAMTRVVVALRAAGVEARDIQTTSLALNPQYAYSQGQAPRLTGYQATNQVSVVVDDLTRLGSVVDAAVGAGATNAGSISFGLKNPVSAQNYARIAAVKALQDKAAIYADATGYHIQRLVRLTEGAPVEISPPRPLLAMAAARATETPVEPGQLTVSIDVTGEFELAH